MVTTRYLTEEIFDAVVKGKQTCLAKLNAGFWYSVTPGQIITFTDGKREVDVIIDTPSFFNNFGDAWFTHGENLIPSSIANIVTPGDAVRFYRTQYKNEDVAACGVIVFSFHTCSKVRTL